MIAEWVPESDWSRVKVGQKVRLVNADGEVTLDNTLPPHSVEGTLRRVAAEFGVTE